MLRTNSPQPQELISSVNNVHDGSADYNRDRSAMKCNRSPFAASDRENICEARLNCNANSSISHIDLGVSVADGVTEPLSPCNASGRRSKKRLSGDLDYIHVASQPASKRAALRSRSDDLLPSVVTSPLPPEPTAPMVESSEPTLRVTVGETESKMSACKADDGYTHGNDGNSASVHPILPLPPPPSSASADAVKPPLLGFSSSIDDSSLTTVLQASKSRAKTLIPSGFKWTGISLRDFSGDDNDYDNDTSPVTHTDINTNHRASAAIYSYRQVDEQCMKQWDALCLRWRALKIADDAARKAETAALRAVAATTSRPVEREEGDGEGDGESNNAASSLYNLTVKRQSDVMLRTGSIARVAGALEAKSRWSLLADLQCALDVCNMPSVECMRNWKQGMKLFDREVLRLRKSFRTLTSTSSFDSVNAPSYYNPDYYDGAFKVGGTSCPRHRVVARHKASLFKKLQLVFKDSEDYEYVCHLFALQLASIQKQWLRLSCGNNEYSELSNAYSYAMEVLDVAFDAADSEGAWTDALAMLEAAETCVDSALVQQQQQQQQHREDQADYVSMDRSSSSPPSDCSDDLLFESSNGNISGSNVTSGADEVSAEQIALGNMLHSMQLYRAFVEAKLQYIGCKKCLAALLSGGNIEEQEYQPHDIEAWGQFQSMLQTSARWWAEIDRMVIDSKACVPSAVLASLRSDVRASQHRLFEWHVCIQEALAQAAFEDTTRFSASIPTHYLSQASSSSSSSSSSFADEVRDVYAHAIESCSAAYVAYKELVSAFLCTTTTTSSSSASRSSTCGGPCVVVTSEMSHHGDWISLKQAGDSMRHVRRCIYMLLLSKGCALEKRAVLVSDIADACDKRLITWQRRDPAAFTKWAIQEMTSGSKSMPTIERLDANGAHEGEDGVSLSRERLGQMMGQFRSSYLAWSDALAVFEELQDFLTREGAGSTEVYIVRSHLDGAATRQLKYAQRLGCVVSEAVGYVCSELAAAEERVRERLREAFHYMSAEDALQRWDVALTAMQSAQDALVSATEAAEGFEAFFGTSAGAFDCTAPLYIDASQWVSRDAQPPTYRGRKLPYSYTIDVFLSALHRFEIRNKSRVLSGGVRDLVSGILKKVMWISKLSINRFNRRLSARSVVTGPSRPSPSHYQHYHQHQQQQSQEREEEEEGEMCHSSAAAHHPFTGGREEADAARCAHLLEDMEARFRRV